MTYTNRTKRFFSLILCGFLCLPLLFGCAERDPDAPAANLSPIAEANTEMTVRSLIDPASEVRGVYIASVYNIDFPTKPDLSASALKKELDSILDNAAAAGLNTVFFQVRPACDALYKSELFPVSEALSSSGKLVMDPLAYIVEQAHKRNIFVHAWVNPLRVTTGSTAKPNTDVKNLPKNSPAAQHPEWTLPYADGRLYLDPGIPAVRDLIADGVREIVKNYDVDGVIFDDYFYPYPVTDASGATVAFKDDASYAAYGRGKNRADWRRDNVNQMVRACYEAIKDVSEDVLFGVAPFGIWKNDDGKNGGSATKGLQSYFSISCDPIAWAEGGYVDYLAPQIYWRFSTAVAPYDELVRWWNRALDGTGVEMLISHAAYQYDGWTEPQGEIAQQVQYARSELSYRGSIFYGYEEIRKNTASLTDELKKLYGERIIYTDPSPTGLKPAVASPADGSYINAASTYLIGSSSPDKPLYLNGKKLGRSRGGYFSAYVDLKQGKNTFTLEQDGMKVTHTIYRGTAPSTASNSVPTSETFAVIGVAPAKNVMADSGGSVTVSCKAPAGASVSAKLGGTTVKMKQTNSVKSANSGWALATYSAVIPLPKTGNDEIRELGEISVTAVSGNNTASAAGASVRVRGSNAYIPVQVLENHTELKLRQDSYYYDDFSVQSAGMTDRAVWQGNGFYLLRVGGYVYENSVKELEKTQSVPVGKLSGVRVYADGKNTYLDFGLDQNVPHNGTVNKGVFEFTLYNVDRNSVPKEITVEKNPLIESVTVAYPNKANCVRFMCKLYDAENFYGFDFAYTEKGAQAILINPRKIDFDAEKPLDGVRIVLDAGHGGDDIGARGPLMNTSASVCEKDLNLAVTLAAKTSLEKLGASVILTRAEDTTVSLTERMDFLCREMPDLSISIHHNSVDYSVDVRNIRGTLGLWWADSGVLLTRCVSDSVASALFRRELSPTQQKLALCRNPKFPSTLVEVGFMTSVEEYEFMLSGSGIARAADGIAEGVMQYFKEQQKWIQ